MKRNNRILKNTGNFLKWSNEWNDLFAVEKWNNGLGFSGIME